MIVKTGSIVLRTVDYSESSVIATLFTKSQGVVSVIAKGARKPKSRFAAALVPGQILETVYYYKPGRSIQTLSEVSYLHKLDQLRVDVKKMALSVTALELLTQVLHEQEENGSLFEWLENLLIWINSSNHVTKKLFPYLQLRITDQIGIGIQPDPTAESSSTGGYLNIEAGTVSPQPEGAESVRLTESQYSFVIDTLHSRKAGLLQKEFMAGELNSLIEYLDRYIRYHVEGVKPRRSDKIFETIFAL